SARAQARAVRPADPHSHRGTVAVGPTPCPPSGRASAATSGRRALVRWFADVCRYVAHIQEIGHLSAADIAHATGANETTVRAWLRGSRSPAGVRAERLAEPSAIVERLARLMEPAYVPGWMGQAVPLL